MVSQYPNATLVTASHATELQNWPGTCDVRRACQTMPVRSSENMVKISRAPSSHAWGTQFLIAATELALEELTSSPRRRA